MIERARPAPQAGEVMEAVAESLRMALACEDAHLWRADALVALDGYAALAATPAPQPAPVDERAAERRGMLRAAEIAAHERRTTAGTSAWDEGMRDMTVRIEKRIRAEAGEPVAEEGWQYRTQHFVNGAEGDYWVWSKWHDPPAWAGASVRRWCEADTDYEVRPRPADEGGGR